MIQSGITYMTENQEAEENIFVMMAIGGLGVISAIPIDIFSSMISNKYQCPLQSDFFFFFEMECVRRLAGAQWCDLVSLQPPPSGFK